MQSGADIRAVHGHGGNTCGNLETLSRWDPLWELLEFHYIPPATLSEAAKKNPPLLVRPLRGKGGGVKAGPLRKAIKKFRKKGWPLSSRGRGTFFRPPLYKAKESICVTIRRE